MANVWKIQAVWEGFPGAPAVNTLYTSAAPDELDAYEAFYTAIAAGIPTNTTITLPNSGNVQDEANGDVNNIWTVPDPVTVDCSGGGDYAGGVGIVIRWLTSTFLEGRRLQGKSFLVPTVGAVFDTNGVLDASYRSTVVTAASDLVNALSPAFGVWHRPVNGEGGEIHTITGVAVSDKAALLRSRRD